MDKTRIFLAAFPTGTGSGNVHGSTRGGDVAGFALCEDGHCLGQHLSSSVEFAKHDLGLNSSRKHDAYEAHCPDGFVLEWVADPEADERWQAAVALNRQHFPIGLEADHA